MKSILIEISFFEALFKVHYTKGFRLTYPIPLPTTVAGIFGAILGIQRRDLIKTFEDCQFGAKLLSYDSIFIENITYLQYKSKGPVKGVVKNTIINNPTYLLALVSENDKKIDEFYVKLRKEIKYFPYGGQNDFFAKSIEIVGVREDINKNSSIIENYAPQDFVENVELEENGEAFILPVKHKLSKNLNFCFVYKGKLKLKNKIVSIENIGVYSLDSFFINKF